MKRLFLLLAVCLMGIGLGNAWTTRVWFDKSTSDWGTPHICTTDGISNNGWTGPEMTLVSGTLYSYYSTTQNVEPKKICFNNDGNGDKQCSDIKNNYGHLYKWNGGGQLPIDMGLYGTWKLLLDAEGLTWSYDNAQYILTRDASTNISEGTFENVALKNGQTFSLYNEYGTTTAYSMSTGKQQFNYGENSDVASSGLNNADLTQNDKPMKFTGANGNYNIYVKVYADDSGNQKIDMTFTAVGGDTPGTDTPTAWAFWLNNHKNNNGTATNETSGWLRSHAYALTKDGNTYSVTIPEIEANATEAYTFMGFNDGSDTPVEYNLSDGSLIEGGSRGVFNATAGKKYKVEATVTDNNGTLTGSVTFTELGGDTPGADAWKVNIDGTDYDLTWNAGNNAYEWASASPLTLKSITKTENNSWNPAGSSEVYFKNGETTYNFLDDMGGANAYWIKNNAALQNRVLSTNGVTSYFVWNNNNDNGNATNEGQFDVTVSVKKDGDSYKATMNFVKKEGTVKPDKEWGIHINDVTGSNWNYDATTKYTWSDTENAYVLDADLSGTIEKGAEFAWYEKTDGKYNLYAEWGGSPSKYYVGSDGCTGIQLIKGKNESGYFNMDEGTYHITSKIYLDGSDWKADVKFTKIQTGPVDPGTDEWKVNIDGTDYTLTWNAGNSAYEWASSEPLTLKSHTNNWNEADQSTNIYLQKGSTKYNYSDSDNNYWLKNDVYRTKLKQTDKNMYFVWGDNATLDISAQYNVTVSVYPQTDGSYKATMKFRNPDEQYYTIYFVVNKNAKKGLGLSDTDDPADKVYIYHYANGEDATQAANDGKWPGLAKFTKAPDTVQDLVPGDDIVYQAEMRTDLPRFVINNNDDAQSPNLLVVDQGVYYWSDDLLPFAALISHNGNTVYRRYDNIDNPLPTRYIYIPASEFSKKDENGNVIEEYTGDLYVYLHADGVDKAGLRGTTKMIREVYNGVAYYKVPSSTITNGTMMTFEVCANGDTEDNKWKYECGDGHIEGDDNHINCPKADRIMKFTVEVEFKENRVYYREGADGTIKYGDILDETSPSSIFLIYDGVAQELTRTEGSIYYWNGKFQPGKNFYFNVEFKNGGRGRIVPAEEEVATYRLSPYEVTVAEASSTNHWISPVAAFTYQVRLDWATQKTWTVPNGKKPFLTEENGQLNPANTTPLTVEATPYSETVENHTATSKYLMDSEFNDANDHFGKTIVSFEATDPDLKASKYNRGAHFHASMQQGEAKTDGESSYFTGGVGVTPHTAGVFNLMVISPSSVEFDRQVATKTVTVLPTIESVGVTINYMPVRKSESGDYVVDYNEELEDFDDPSGESEIKFGNKNAFIEIGEEMIKHLDGYDTMTDEEKNAARAEAAKKHGIRYYFAYEKPKPADNGKYKPARIVGTQDAPAGYTEAIGKNGIDLDYAFNNGGFRMIVEENNQRSHDVKVTKGEIKTAIDGVEAEETEATWYDLQGNRVENPERGLYIRVRNGKADKVAL